MSPLIYFFPWFLQSSSTIPICTWYLTRLEELRPHVNLKGWDKVAPAGSVFSRLQLSGAGSAGGGIFFPELPLSVYCWFWSDIQVHNTQRVASFPHVQIPLPTPECYKQNSPLRSVLLHWWALASLWLHLQRAGNFSLYPLKPGGGNPARQGGGSTRQITCCQPPLAVSPQGKMVI